MFVFWTDNLANTITVCGGFTLHMGSTRKNCVCMCYRRNIYRVL